MSNGVRINCKARIAESFMSKFTKKERENIAAKIDIEGLDYYLNNYAESQFEKDEEAIKLINAYNDARADFIEYLRKNKFDEIDWL